MDKLNIFIPITKVDAVKRLVSGCLTAEVVDKANEIMDYESGKPEFQKWSGEFEKNTNGKSLGNVRAMHGNIAAGKLTEILFDDVGKSITGTAKIVDDAEWQKVLEGVYTGFSIGGKYKKKWKDPADSTLTRFTPEPAEVSIVDNPCVAEAVFELIRADGSTEMCKFRQAEPVKVLNKIPAPEQVWKANDGTTYAKKEDALKKNAELQAQQDKDPALAILDKVNAALDSLEIDPETLGKKDFTDKERKKLAENGHALPDGSFPISDIQDLKNAIHAFGRAKDKAKAKTHIIARAKELGETALLPANWHKEGKGDHKDDGSEGNKFTGVKLKKGLHEVARGACLIQELEWLCTQIEWEQASENDNESNQPDELKHIITTLCSWLQDAVEEECREIVEPHAVDLMEMAAGLPEDHANAVRKFIKADKLVAVLEKAGARHSKADSAKLAELHDKIGEMGDHLGKLAEAHDNIEEAHDDIKSDHRAMGKCMGKAADGKMDDMKELHSEMGEHIKKAKDAHGEAEDVHGEMEDTHSEMHECMKCLMSGDKSAPVGMQKNTEEMDLIKADNAKKDETIKKLTDGLTDLAKRLKVIESQPVTTNLPTLFVVEKGHERESGNAQGEAKPNEPDRNRHVNRI